MAAMAQPKHTAAVGPSNGAQLSSPLGPGNGASSRAGGGNTTMEVSTVAAEDAALHKYKAAASCSDSTYLPCQLTTLQDLQADIELVTRGF